MKVSSLILLIAMLPLATCKSSKYPQEVYIRVTGTKGNVYEGEIRTLGETVLIQCDTIPSQYKMILRNKHDKIRGYITKLDPGGVLFVEYLKNNEHKDLGLVNELHGQVILNTQ